MFSIGLWRERQMRVGAEAEEGGEMLVRSFLPAGAPHDVVVPGEVQKVPGRPDRKQMGDAVDLGPCAFRDRIRWKAEQAEHTVDVTQQQRPARNVWTLRVFFSSERQGGRGPGRS